MNTIFVLLRKEFIQISRQPVIIGMIFVMPIVQLLILANAADYEVDNVNLHIIDQDLSQASSILKGKFFASPHFNVVNTSFSNKKGQEDLQSGVADLSIEIPPQFEQNLFREGKSKIQIAVNAINGTKALLGSAYTEQIIQGFAQEYIGTYQGGGAQRPGIYVTFSYWYNPTLDYNNFMVPGILVILVTLVGMFLCGLNIVREKELGTIEQINVTPIKRYQFIIGKLVPFWLIGLFELALGLIIGKLVFDIPLVGSLWLVFGFASIYLLVVLGLGLFISTITYTQQQAMFVAFFFLIIFILMSGLFTPIESMPVWAQYLTRGNPIAYFVDVMRVVLLKGGDFASIQRHFLVIGILGIAILTLAMLNYRKTTA